MTDFEFGDKTKDFDPESALGSLCYLVSIGHIQKRDMATALRGMFEDDPQALELADMIDAECELEQQDEEAERIAKAGLNGVPSVLVDTIGNPSPEPVTAESLVAQFKASLGDPTQN